MIEVALIVPIGTIAVSVVQAIGRLPETVVMYIAAAAAVGVSAAGAVAVVVLSRPVGLSLELEVAREAALPRTSGLLVEGETALTAMETAAAAGEATSKTAAAKATAATTLAAHHAEEDIRVNAAMHAPASKHVGRVHQVLAAVIASALPAGGKRVSIFV